MGNIAADLIKESTSAGAIVFQDCWYINLLHMAGRQGGERKGAEEEGEEEGDEEEGGWKGPVSFNIPPLSKLTWFFVFKDIWEDS